MPSQQHIQTIGGPNNQLRPEANCITQLYFAGYLQFEQSQEHTKSRGSFI